MKKLKSIRAFSIFIFMLVIMELFTAMPSSAVTFTSSKGTVKVKCGSYSHTFNAKNYGNNFTTTLNYALRIAASKATKSKIATVTVTKGNYNLYNTLYIYSNTKLVATDCTFRLRTNILRNGYDNTSSAKGYSGAENITVVGGTWDMNEPYSKAGITDFENMHTQMRFGHCKNILIKNCTFVNNYNCHDVELGGVDTATITGCTFSNAKSVSGIEVDGGREAVQIDSNEVDAMPIFPSYDYTPCKNIKIKNNTFKNKFRGIGSHHGIVGNTYDNITVCNNTFTNIAGYGIYAVYWTNSKIYNNKFEDVGAGMDIRPMIINQNLNFLNKMNLTYFDSEYVTKKSSLYVYGNEINVRSTKPLATPFGIRVAGAYTAEKDTLSGLNPGEYNAYNIIMGADANGKAKPNIMRGYMLHGIYGSYSDSLKIKNNVIDMTQSPNGTAYGINLKGVKKSLVTDNTITNGTKGNSRGIYLGIAGSGAPCVGTEISGNTISDFSYAGLTVSGCTDTTIKNNNISNAKYGATIVSGVNTSLVNNNISNISANGVYSYNGSTGTKVTENNISSTKIGFFLNDKDETLAEEEKTLTVTNNTFTCPDIKTPISLVYANLWANVSDNKNSDNSTFKWQIKGTGEEKYTTVSSALANGKLSVNTSDTAVNLSWKTVKKATGYRITRTVYRCKDVLCDVADTSYEDCEALLYKPEANITYSLCPFINSAGIKLAGKQTDFVGMNHN